MNANALPYRCLTVALTIAATASTSLYQETEYRYIGPDGDALPLSEEEVLDFLANGEIVERETISIGINGIDRLVLERDGLRLRAGFREVDARESGAHVGGTTYLEFRDSYLFEPAAYRLATALGIPNVPPAVNREINRVEGSVQLWIEDLFPEAGAVKPENPIEWARQLWTMIFFDALIHNVDRNPGNLLIDRRYRLWMIDHTRAFQLREDPFDLDRVQHVSRSVWERIQALERSDFDEIFSGLLEPAQVGFFMDRRDRLVEHINQLLAERPEAAVLY